MTLEFLEERRSQTVKRREPPLRLAEVLAVLRQVCSGVEPSTRREDDGHDSAGASVGRAAAWRSFFGEST